MNNEDLKNHVLSIINDIENGVEAEDYQLEELGLEEGDILSGYDYLADILDIEYIISGDGEYRGARVLVAFGGPNIWINTKDKLVEGYWWSDSFTESYVEDVMDIDGALEEFWEMRQDG